MNHPPMTRGHPLASAARPLPATRPSMAVQTFSLAQKQFCWSGIGIRDAESADPAMPAHRHSFFQVLFVVKGSAVHELDGRVFDACAGSIFFIRPFVVHRIAYTPGTECYVLYFDARFLQARQNAADAGADDGSFSQLPELAPFVYQPCCAYQLAADEMTDARARCQRIARACASRGLFDAAEARAELTLLLTSVGKKYAAAFQKIDRACEDGHFLDRRARQAIAYLRKHFRRDLTLQEVAREVNLTGNYLTLLLKRETGKSFKQLLDELRLENSKDLLAYTDTPIKRIAAESGFLDQAHFARRFKSFTSETPGLFRRRCHAPTLP